MSKLSSSPDKLSAWLLIILILIATWVRLWQFPNIPPAFNYDEAYNVIDTLWLRENNSFVAFLPGNTGRHALFHYLAIPFLAILGVNIFAFRFLSVVIGITVVPLIYRWVTTMFANDPMRHYLGLIASAGLTFSFWHIAISRSGFRASLLLLLYILMAYLFWRGWQHRSAWAIAGAGVALGLSQYTYWLAALLPLQFGLFAIILTLGSIRKLPLRKSYPTYDIKKMWQWIGIMAVASLIIFIPLGLFYLDTPLVLQYVSQSSIVDKIANDGKTTWLGHLFTSLRIFLDGPVALWQGQISRSLRFDWLTLIGFWLGLIVAIKRRHQPAYPFLLAGLFVLWLPAPLNDIDFSDLRLPDMLPVHHAISNLRIAGVLPIYYTLVAIGLLTAVRWISQRIGWLNTPQAVGIATFILVVIISGSINTYNFFGRWPKQPFIYERYNGPILDLAQDLVRESRNHDILIPFHLYAHPTMHLFFDEIFTESDTSPGSDSRGSAILVTTPNTPISSYMWLVRSEFGPGLAYMTPPLETDELLRLSNQPIQTFDLAAPLMFTAQTSLIPNLEPLQPQLAEWTVPNPVNYSWGDQVQLVGYQVTPNWTQPGQPINITLYWQNLTDQPLTHDVFIHLINSRGEGVGQVDGVMLGDGHRWRKGKITPTNHTIQLGDQLRPGPYLIRLGLFNTRTGARITIIGADGESLGDQVLLGLFYISEGDQVPAQPVTTIQATLGEQIQLVGYSLPEEQTLGDEITLSPEIHWRATKPIDKNYTIFLQLLDNQNQFVTGYDTQPLHGNYPTYHWQTGELIIERIDLPLPSQLEPGDYRLVTGMYEASTGQRLVAINDEGQPYNDYMVPLANMRVLADKIIFAVP